MKILKTSLVIIALVLGVYQAKACHGLPLQNYLVTVGATGVTINGSSDPSTCGCGPYWLQTEISCTGTFVGTQPACLTATLTNWNNAATSYVSFPYFNSLLNVPGYSIGSGWLDNCTPEAYIPNFIPFANLCPGKVYFIRSREMVLGGGNTGPWTAIQSFTVPGIAPPPGAGALTLGLNAMPATVFCGGGTALTPTWLGSCPNTCAPNFPSCEATTTIVPSYSFVATNPVLPGGVTTTIVPAATSASVINIPSLTSATTFSVYFIYKVISLGGIISYSATSGPGAYPMVFGNMTNSFVTAPATSVFMIAKVGCCIPNSCPITQPGTVFVNVINILPVANVTITPNTCLSAPSFTFNDINAVAGMNYNWNFGDGTTSTVNPTIHNYTSAGIYTVTFVKSGGLACMPLTTTYTVQVFPNSTTSINVNTPVCYGGTISFTNTVTNGNTYNWSGPNVFSSSVQSPVITNATAAMAGVYNCTVTSINGCTATANANVSTYQAALTLNSNSTVCAGSLVNLTASGSGSYGWTGPNGFTSIQQNPVLTPTSALAAGIYTVNATLTGGCSASATTAVIVNTTNVTASNNGPVCSGNNAQLTANGVGTFIWVGPNGFASTQQNPILTGATSLASGIYTVTITSPQGCTQTATTNLSIQAPKILSPKSTSTMCENGVVTLESLDAGGVSFLWMGPNGFTANTAYTAIQDVTPLNSGIYTITMTDPFGCIAQGTVQVSVFAKPNVDIDMSKATSGCEPRTGLEFKAISSSNGLSYAWNLGNGSINNSDNPKNINYNTANSYTVSVIASNANGCVATKSKILEVYPVPVANFSNTPNPSFVNPQVYFTDFSTNGNITNWNWTFGLGPDVSSTQQNPNYTYQDSGKYDVTLKVKTDKGCENTITKKVIVNDEGGLFLPNAFTPNGDGQNDIFMAVSNGVNKFEMLIFNRGGSLLFQTSDVKKGWDGMFKGQLAESNVYVYKVNYTSKDGKGHTLTGSVTLIK